MVAPQDQNRDGNDFYGITYDYSGVSDPETAGAICGCAIGYFLGHTCACCVIGMVTGACFGECLSHPHRIYLGIQIYQRRISFHFPSFERIDRR